MEKIPQSVAFRVPLKAYLASDHLSAATGKTIAVVISKNGAAFGNPSAGATNATEVANGWYYVDLSATDAGTVGPLLVRGTAGTIDDVEVAFLVHNPGNWRKGIAKAGFTFLLKGTDGLPRTGLTVSATRSIDGAAFASCTNAVSEVANGWYKVDISTSDLNGDVVAFRFVATGIADHGFTVITQQ